jgi:hypothetical protein
MNKLCIECGKDKLVLYYKTDTFLIERCQECDSFIFYWITGITKEGNVCFDYGQIIKSPE